MLKEPSSQNKKKLLITVLVVIFLFSIPVITEWWEKHQQEPAPSNPSSSATITVADKEQALDQLSNLPVMGPVTSGYKRTDFGTPWADVDKNNCDTRNDILKRDLTAIKYKTGSSCIVEEGVLKDPYTGKTINFVKGHGALIDIDHIVALGNVWASGGNKLTPEERKAIANDPENLLAVDAPANRAKGDKNAAEWLPPNADFQCNYVVKQIAVKAKYKLTVTLEEESAMEKVLNDCSTTP